MHLVVEVAFALWALASFLSGGWAAFLLARRCSPETRGSARLLLALLSFLIIQQGLINLLSALSLFHVYVEGVAFPLLGLAADRLLGGAEGRRGLREDLARAREAFLEMRKPWSVRIVLVGAAVVALPRALGGLVAPPLCWDTLTYHAFKAARWVQHGTKIFEFGPDQWGYLQFFPDGAENLWAHGMLFLQGDLGMPVTGVFLWLAVILAAYGVARQLGAARIPSLFAGLSSGFLPAVLTLMVSGYADLYVLLVFLLLGSTMVGLHRERSWRLAGLAGCALGLLADAKLSGLAIAAVGFFTLGILAWNQRSASPLRSWLGRFAVAALGLLVVAAPHYLTVWMLTGSPFYPLTIHWGGRVLFPGNLQLAALYAGKLVAGNPAWASAEALLLSLLLPYELPKLEFAGFGPSLLLLLPFFVLGLARLSRRRANALPAWSFLLMAALPLLGLFSPDFAGQRSLWLPNLGRLIAHLPVTMAVIAAQRDGRTARLVWLVALALFLCEGWPLGLANPMLDAIEEFAPWLALGLSLSVIGTMLLFRHPALRPRSEWGPAILAGFLTLCLFVPVTRVRGKHRYALYSSSASDPPAFVMAALWPEHASAWPIWQALDDGAPHRIAASYGWDGIGHNWFRYPLLGSRLQNRVLYLPITRTGAIVDYQDARRVAEEADDQAWLRRLSEANVQYVVLGFPAPPEKTFIQKNARLFRHVATTPDGRHSLFQFLARHAPPANAPR